MLREVVCGRRESCKQLADRLGKTDARRRIEPIPKPLIVVGDARPASAGYAQRPQAQIEMREGVVDHR
jgi:hypothetical protein